MTEWTVHELAARAGISDRTLRHYHHIGLLHPDRVGNNGYRYYGRTAVHRLHRILGLRDAGMALADIAKVLDAPAQPDAELDALQAHLADLTAEREALDRRITVVNRSIALRREGREPPMDAVLDGFNDRYEAEVVHHWGQEAFDASNQWWHTKSVAQQRAWQDSANALLNGWTTIYRAGHPADSDVAQHHATAHIAWFAEIPGTPTHAGDSEQSAARVSAMADLYETSPDFHDAFDGPEAAAFAARALRLRIHHGI